MTPDGVVGIGREAIETILLVAGPMLILGLVVGLMVSAFQAMTQINEATLTFCQNCDHVSGVAPGLSLDAANYRGVYDRYLGRFS